MGSIARVISAEVKASIKPAPFQLGTFELVIKPKDNFEIHRLPLRLREVMWLMEPLPPTRKGSYVFSSYPSSDDNFKLRPRIAFKIHASGGTIEVSTPQREYRRPRRADAANDQKGGVTQKHGDGADIDNKDAPYRTGGKPRIWTSYTKEEFAELQRDILMGFPLYCGLTQTMSQEAWQEMRETIHKAEMASREAEDPLVALDEQLDFSKCEEGQEGVDSKEERESEENEQP